LTYAKTGLRSPYGMIRCEWNINGLVFDLKITVPANATATVYVPATDLSRITESGQAVHDAPGVTLLRQENGLAVFAVESGSYAFQAS